VVDYVDLRLRFALWLDWCYYGSFLSTRTASAYQLGFFFSFMHSVALVCMVYDDYFLHEWRMEDDTLV